MTEPVQFAAPEGPAPTPVPVTPIVKPKGRGGNLTNILLGVAALVAVGGIAFAAGRAMAPATPAGAFARSGAGTGAFPTGSFDPGAAPGGRFGGAGRTATISGTVTSVDGTTMVITTADGTETTIDLSGTTYHAQAAATAADVTTGATVQVSVEGFGGFRGAPAAPGASAAPDASAGTGAGSGTISATDVLVTSGQ